MEAVVIHAALIGAGSLSGELMRPLLRRRRLRQRFLRIEGPRAVAELRNLLPRSLDYMICEDIARIAESPAASLALARTRETLPGCGLYLGALRPREILSGLQRASVASGERDANERGGAATASAPKKGANDRSTWPVPQTRMPDDTSLFSAGNGSTLMGRLVHALLRRAGVAGATGPVGGDFTSSPGAARRAATLVTAGVVSNQLNICPTDKQLRYPEWDSRIERYRPEWCTVRIIEPHGHPQESLPATDLGLHRPLSRLGTGPAIRRRQPFGDDIDIDAAIDDRVGALAASWTDEGLYLATVRERRDLSALILLDVSGSTAEPGVGRVRVHDHQRLAVAALAVTMHRLGDRVAVYAFSSHGRHNVQLTALKTFADHDEHLLLKRLRHLQPSGYSRLGAAIRHGANEIEQHGGTTRRLLIVVSDGLAFDHGYDLDHGARDVRRALAEVRGRGTGCLCLTVGVTAPPEDLRLAFGAAAHASVPRPEQLAASIVGLFRAALRAAEIRRFHQTSPNRLES
ncbi:MAG TPA: VWA domain-containing protein [Mycobacterium sp.]